MGKGIMFDWRIANIKYLWPQAETLLTKHAQPLTPAQEQAIKNLIAAVQAVIVVFGGKKNLIGMES